MNPSSFTPRRAEEIPGLQVMPVKHQPPLPRRSRTRLAPPATGRVLRAQLEKLPLRVDSHPLIPAASLGVTTAVPVLFLLARVRR
jgi:hypothetical protein